ncbi:hypothetical protein PhCBS80983_g05312 [Powellomyces hirtus]|uniref:Mitochondrial carrier protein n=1 Tax=Powellomyces hirtus TaxID=109895 RepID=A0A507DW97_9FUNG|nr:hypothetical protein PhCBS80983_g05312 [Powellomyces hirtus]
MSNTKKNPPPLLYPTFLHSDPLSHVAFSSCAAIVARTVAHPLDTLKTRIQFASTSTNPTALGHIRATIRSTLKNEPITALYRGLPVALLFSVPALSVYLGAYDYSKTKLGKWGKLGEEDAMGVHAIASCCAEVLSGALWTPMEVLKNKLQVQTKATNPTIGSLHTWALCKSIYRNEGLRGFYKGYFLALGVFVPYTMVYFMSYEQLKMRAAAILLPKSASSLTTSSTTSPLPISSQPASLPPQLPFIAYVICSGLSGALAGGVSNGLDIVKTRVQAAAAGGTQQSATTIVRHMWTHEGKWRAFGRGLGARILWIMPTVTLSMSVYEMLKDWRVRQLTNDANL